VNRSGPGRCWAQVLFAVGAKRRAPLANFLQLRAQHLRSIGIDPAEGGELLIPALQVGKSGRANFTGSDIPYEGYQVRDMFAELRVLTGIPIRPKTLRTHYAKALQALGLTEDQCAALLTHTNPKTTRTYYAALNKPCFEALRDRASRMYNSGNSEWAQPDSNRRSPLCESDVITD